MEWWNETYYDTDTGRVMAYISQNKDNEDIYELYHYFTDEEIKLIGLFTSPMKAREALDKGA